RPANPQELFKLCHSQAHNAVERIFGIIKNRWTILVRPPAFDMSIQVFFSLLVLNC
ncbi:hypothetical protein AMATHDRAFT_153857, partial [Amanita thiersii Skay4041]